MTLRFSLALLFAAAVVSLVEAHDTWLIPDSFSASKGAAVLLDLSSGMAFPALDTSIKPERVDRAECRLSNKSHDITSFAPAPNSLRLEVSAQETGIATVWVELKPNTLELTPAQVLEYLEEIGGHESLRKQWENSKEPMRWREEYTKHSKTFLRVGNPKSDRSWADPVGMSLEIVPEKDPTTLRAGDDFTVRVLKSGAPLKDFPIGFVHAENAKGEIHNTDSHGRVTFRIKASGRGLLRGTELIKTSRPELDWESHFTTLTFEVAE